MYHTMFQQLQHVLDVLCHDLSHDVHLGVCRDVLAAWDQYFWIPWNKIGKKHILPNHAMWTHSRDI